jgi:hypothetical protein
MTDTKQNSNKNNLPPLDAGDSTNSWLTPLEAASLIGVNKRYVYRLVETGELTTDGKLRGQKISRSSAEQARLKRIAQSAIAHDYDEHMAQGTNDATVRGNNGSNRADLAMRREVSGQIAQSAIMALSKERDDLQAKYDALQEAWRADIHRLEEARRFDAEARRLESVQSALELGQYKERVKNLEAQLQAAQTLPQPPPAPVPVQPVTIEQPQQTASEPIKKGFWQRMFGG